MKLIKLIFALLGIIFDLVYYIIASPVIVPVSIYKWHRNKVWRKNVKVGDRCFFINGLSKRTYGEVTGLSGNRAGLKMNNASGWYDINILRKI